MLWTIVTRMPSTARLTHFKVCEGAHADFEACRNRWSDVDHVVVTEATQADVEVLDVELRS